MDEITLDKKTFEALAIDTRIDILKSLKQRRKTQAELSKELKLAPSTVSEHLDKMLKAELVEKHNQGKKWIYYELTEKGAAILSPSSKTPVFVFVLSVSLILTFAGLFLMTQSSFGGSMAAAVQPDVIKATEDRLTGAYADEQITAAAPSVDENLITETGVEKIMGFQHEYISKEKTGIVFIALGVILLMTAFKIRNK